jgi:plastocyanin
MKRFGVVFVLIALLAMPAVATAQYPSGGGGGSSGGGIQIGGGGSPGGDSSQTGMADVSIVDFAFQPMVIFVGVGETVEWTNTGNADHTVDSDTEIFESGHIKPRQTYRYTFDEPGIFPYHCDIHPHMRGMVVVTGL